MSPYIEQKNAFFSAIAGTGIGGSFVKPVTSSVQVASLVKAGCGDPVDDRGVPKFTSCAANRRRLHTCRHHRSDIRDASGMAYRRKRALCAMPCVCDRRLQSATRRDLVIEACVRIISSCGDQSLGETPGPIPNPEAKA